MCLNALNNKIWPHSLYVTVYMILVKRIITISVCRISTQIISRTMIKMYLFDIGMLIGCQDKMHR